MNKHSKKMIVPIVVSLVVIIYYVAYFFVLLSILEGVWKYVLGILPLLLSVMMIKVCIERIIEIRKGEEDDISKY